jgi:hypothetical protein
MVLRYGDRSLWCCSGEFIYQLTDQIAAQEVPLHLLDLRVRLGKHIYAHGSRSQASVRASLGDGFAFPRLARLASRLQMFQ